MNTETRSRLDNAAAYDRIAADYDLQLQDMQWMRSVLWDAYRRLLVPGQRVLDLSCGTGIDAIFLARHGIEVVGIDISAGMLEQLRMKAAQEGLSDRIHVARQDIHHLDLMPHIPFDGIISAFAGLSTLTNLAPVVSRAACMLKPGGILIVHMLNRFSVWNWLALIRHGRWAQVRQAGLMNTLIANIGGIPIQHTLYYPLEAYERFFARDFALRNAYSLGSLRPPNAPLWLPRSVLNLMGRLEKSLAGHRPFINWGSFFVLEMQKRESASRSMGFV
jgi:ubiquinone/menaquinone biosynthesis C-methylase UbiE